VTENLDSFLRRTSVLLIDWYQRTISPRKGFACAHRVRYGGESCSQFAMKAFETRRWWQCMRTLIARLSECSHAARGVQGLGLAWHVERGRGTGVRLDQGPHELPKDPQAQPPSHLPVVESTARCCLMGWISFSAVGPGGPTIGCANAIFRSFAGKPLVETNREATEKSELQRPERELRPPESP
jgi:putative component of membrane protein insertase Oxa1/YidC/SpoIIIJ protein YidD